jgi:hypothetical protein
VTLFHSKSERVHEAISAFQTLDERRRAWIAPVVVKIDGSEISRDQLTARPAAAALAR